MPSRRKQDTISTLSYFLPAVVAFVVAAFVNQPWIAALIVAADASIVISIAWLAGCRFEDRFSSALFSRGVACFGLLICYTAFVEIVIGYPISWLLRDPSLGATLALSTTCVLVLLSLWKMWPSFGLTCVWRNASTRRLSSDGVFSSMSKCLSLARRITDANELFFSHGLLVSICLLVLAEGAISIAGFGFPLHGTRRLVVLAIYALAIVPLASLVIINRTASALMIERQRDRRERSEKYSAHPANAGIADEAPTQLPEAATKEELDAMLLRCVRAGQTQLALAALNRGADPNTTPTPTDRDQRSVVELASVSPDMRLLRGLISKGANLNRAHAGLAPLIAATRDSLEGRPDAVMMLLTNGADPRCADANGDTPLHCAALCEKPIMAALLCDAGASLDAVNAEGLTPLGAACEIANWETARFLLERGAKIDTEHGQPALIAASAVDDDDPLGVKLLLKRKARVDARGPLKRTALMTAALNDNAFIAQLLLDAGAQIDLVDAHGVTALMEAARAGAADVLDVFASRQPSVDLADARGRTALIIACQSAKANEDIVRRLLDMGASRVTDVGDGRRAVDFAAKRGRWDIVALLDPEYPRPENLASESNVATPAEDSPEHLLDALRFGHWSIVDRFESIVRDWPQDELARLFIELISNDDRAPGRWLLAHGLSQEWICDQRTLLVHASASLPDSLNAVVDLLDASASCGGGDVLRYACEALQSTERREELESLALRVIESGADVFAADESGVTPLALAASAGSVRVMSALLAHGVDPNIRDHLGRTPLYAALYLPSEIAIESVKLLIRAGANPDVAATNGETPLGIALARPEPQLQHWLNWHLWKLPQRALRNDDLLSASAAGDVSAIRKLIVLGLSINTADAQGATPLLRAAGSGHADAVVCLLENGADATRAANSGATALSAAVIARSASVITALTSHGVDVNQRLKGGGTALMIAAALGYSEVVMLLLDSGASADAVDETHTRALHAAAHFAFHGRDTDRARQTLDALLDHGASVGARNSEGQTPLLLLLGAHAEAGATADQKALLALMPLLLKRHADINAADNRGVTALHACAMHGLLLPARALIAAGADVQLRDMRERTAREVAHLLGFIDVAAELGAQSPLLAPVISARKAANELD